MVLYLNACVRGEGSRTDRLARAYLKTRENVVERRLSENGMKPLDRETLEKRTALIAAGRFDDEMFAPAREFAAADEIVVGAPLWDLGFPACLKVYLENIYVTGVVSRYSPEGVPVGLCRAKRLVYVTTAGGPLDARFGYDYLASLAKGAFGISETRLISAEGLDLDGADADAIIAEAVRQIG